MKIGYLFKKIYSGFDTLPTGEERQLYEYRLTPKGIEKLEWLLLNVDKLKIFVEGQENDKNT